MRVLNNLLCHRTCHARGRRAGPALWCDGGTRARGDAIKLEARVTTVGGYRVLDGGRVAHKTAGWALKSPTICHIKSDHDDSSWYNNLSYMDIHFIHYISLKGASYSIYPQIRLLTRKHMISFA